MPPVMCSGDYLVEIMLVLAGYPGSMVSEPVSMLLLMCGNSYHPFDYQWLLPIEGTHPKPDLMFIQERVTSLNVLTIVAGSLINDGLLLPELVAAGNHCQTASSIYPNIFQVFACFELQPDGLRVGSRGQEEAVLKLPMSTMKDE